MTDPDDDDYPAGTLASEMQKLAVGVENFKRVFFAEMTKALMPLVDYMAKVGRRDRP